MSLSWLPLTATPTPTITITESRVELMATNHFHCSILSCLATLLFLVEVSGQTDWHAHPELHLRDLSEMVYDPGRDRIVLFGGYTGRSNSNVLIELNDTWEWDGRVWTFRRPVQSPSPRFGHSMAYDYKRKSIILFGGTEWPPPNQTMSPFLDTWEWDGHNWTRLFATSGPRAGQFPSMESDPTRGEILLFGGLSQVTGGYSSATWIWDGTRWTQRFPLTIPRPRGIAAMAVDPSTGRITMAGGFGVGTVASGNDIWDWDGANWNRLTPSNGIFPADGFGDLVADTQNNGLLGVFGSIGGLTVWRWNQSTWTPLPRASTMLRDRSDSNTFTLNTRTQQAIIAGGTSPFPSKNNDTSRTTRMFDLKTSKWTIAHTQEKPTASCDAIYDAKRDHVLLVATPADYWASGTPLTTWSWTQEGGYKQLHPKTSPPNRRASYGTVQSALGYHASSGNSVLFGSYELKNDSLTWVWDGSDWSGSLMPGPDPSKLGAFAWDTTKKRLLYYVSASTAIWEWTPTKWNLLDPGKPGLLPHTVAIAFDSRRGVLVALGLPPGGKSSETWEWDGAQWLRRFSFVTPPLAYGRRLEYASWLGGCVLVGGRSSLGGGSKDTGLWDGTNWRRLAITSLPNYRDGRLHAAVADPGRQRILTFFDPSLMIDNVYELLARPLTSDVDEVRLGGVVKFALDLPAEANKVWVLGLSFGLRPAIPLLPNPISDHTLFPLANDILLQGSLQYGLGGVLDNQGKGTFRVPVPNDSSLSWRDVYGAAITVSPGVSIDSITNALHFLIVD